jgi:hypothetical protein
MSEILTVASVKGAGGFQEWGRLTRSEAIARTREYARDEVERLQKIVDAPDEAFYVRVVRGPLAQRLIERL